MAKINSFNLEGIGFTPENTRFYPEANIGGQLFGFVNKQTDNSITKGAYGIEGCYDKDLAGESGRPDIEEFVAWKVNEEKKVAALIAAGYDSAYESEAYQTVSGQNSNNSVSIFPFVL